MVGVGLLELYGCLRTPFIQAHIQDVGTYHIAGIERGDGDGATDDRGGEDLLTTLEGELDHGVFGTFECLHNLLGGQ